MMVQRHGMFDVARCTMNALREKHDYGCSLQDQCVTMVHSMEKLTTTQSPHNTQTYTHTLTLTLTHPPSTQPSTYPHSHVIPIFPYYVWRWWMSMYAYKTCVCWWDDLCSTHYMHVWHHLLPSLHSTRAHTYIHSTSLYISYDEPKCQQQAKQIIINEANELTF